MKNKLSRTLLFTTCLAALFIVIVISCNKKFDAPPAYIPPNINATTSIAALKAAHISGNVDSFTTDMIISGVVIANDSSGNFYKQIVIQDTTGGIAVSIDDYNLYASFPIGRKVYVKLKGLYMSENTGLLYIGGTPDNGGTVSGIASRLKDQYLVKAEINVPVTPAVVTISDLRNNPSKYMYTLVQLQNFEIKPSDTAKTYAFSSATSTTDANIIVKGCGSNDTMIIRTSGYSYFANVNVPNGNGTLTAVYAYYKSPYNSKITPQVIIRDTSDVQFTGTRCDGTEPPPTNGVLTSIKSIRALYTGSNTKLGAYKIGGVVISDAANKNVSSGSVILQDGDRGISVYFGGTVSYNVGDSIVLDISGDSLLSYRGSLEIKTAYGTTPPASVATGKVVAPTVLTLSQLNSSLSDIEFTVVKIKSATASGASSFAGNQKLTDATDDITLYTSSSASFASTSLPSGAKDWTGYGSFYNTTKQFQIRNTGDIADATTGGTDTTTIPPTNGTNISLTTSPYTIDFNTIDAGLPTGVSVQTGAKASMPGTDASFASTKALWKTTTGGFKNFASATGLLEGSDSTTQLAAANRALGVRQTGSTDPGIAFVFAINNTSGKSSLALTFQLQSLDTSSPRATTWIVDYAVGDNPTLFTQASTGTLITGNHIFSNTPVSINFGNALDNQSGKVWIRVVTLAASTGSGKPYLNRASTAVDDVNLTFN